MRHRMLLLFTFGFSAGIALAPLNGGGWWYAVALGTVAIVLLCAVKVFSPAPIMLVGIALGALRLYMYFPPASDIEAFAGPAPVTVVGSICSEPSTTPQRTSFLLRTSEVVTRQGIEVVDGVTEVLVHGAAYSTFIDPRCGDSLQATGILQKLVPATNSGEFDWRARMIGHGVSGEIVVQRPNGAEISKRPSPLSGINDWSRESEKRLEQTFSVNLPGVEPALLAGILFGHRSELSDQMQQQFLATGTAHVLATAGLHVGIIAMCLETAFGLFPLPRKIRALIIIALLWAFAMLAGGRPAVVRAVVAATIYFAGFVFERVPDLATTLATAAVALLAVQPTLLFQSDFQLSFATVIGLALLLPFWEEWIESMTVKIESRWRRKVVRSLLELAGLSMIAQLCSAPLIAYYYNQFSILSLPVNLVVVPLLFLIIPAAIIGILSSFLSEFVGSAIFHFAVHPLLRLTLNTVQFVSGFPLCSVSVSSPPAVDIIALYTVVYGAAVYYRPRPKESSRAISSAAS